jgi:hypothetical protein
VPVRASVLSRTYTQIHAVAVESVPSTRTKRRSFESSSLREETINDVRKRSK